MTREAALSWAVTAMHSAVTDEHVDDILRAAVDSGLPPADADVLRQEWGRTRTVRQLGGAA